MIVRSGLSTSCRCGGVWSLPSRSAGKAMIGPRLAAAELFEVLPIAVLQAQHAPVKGERPKVRVSAAAK